MLSVGEILRKERIKKNLSLPQIEKEIKIRQKFLTALEENDWNAFSSKIYIIGIIKNYAQYLGVDSLKLTAFFRRDFEKKEEIKFKRRLSVTYVNPQTKKIIFAGLVMVFIIFLGYFGFQLMQFLSPPEVQILQPKKNQFLNTEKITIIGLADKESAITVSGEKVYQDQEGKFIYNLPLKKGTNNVVIEVIGANGKKTVVSEKYLSE